MIATLRSAKADAWVAAVFGVLFVWAMYTAFSAAEEELRRYGRNVDSGALQGFAGVFYLAPVCLLFALASLAQWRGWRMGRFLHWFAIFGAVAPPVSFFVTLGLRGAL